MSVMLSLLSWFLLAMAAGGGLHTNSATAEVTIASDSAVVSAYWHTMLPNTPMPPAILELLTPPAGIIDHIGRRNTNKVQTTEETKEDKYVGLALLKTRKMGLHSTKEANTLIEKIRKGVLWWVTSRTNDVQKSNFQWGPPTTNDVQKHNFQWGPSTTNGVQKHNFQWGPPTTNDVQKHNFQWGPSTANGVQKHNFQWGPPTANDVQKHNFQWGPPTTNDVDKHNFQWGPPTTNDVQKHNFQWGPSTANNVQKSNFQWGPSTSKDVQKSNFQWGPSTANDVQKTNFKWDQPTTNNVQKSNFQWGPSVWGPPKRSNVKKTNFQWSPSVWGPSTKDENQEDDQKGVPLLETGESHIGRDNHGHGTMSNMVFLEEALKPGSTITCYIQPSFTSGAPLLRRDVVDAIPVSTRNFTDIVKLFAPTSNYMAADIWSTLEFCEHPRAIKGETKRCATSVESMVDFAASVLGVSTYNLRAFSSPDVPVEGVMTGRGYKVVETTRVTEEGDTVTCHGMRFPFAMFMCHAVNPTRVYSVMLEEEDVDADGVRQKMEVLAVCHLDTSYFDPAKMPVHVKPGDAPLCHFISRESILLAPPEPASGGGAA